MCDIFGARTSGDEMSDTPVDAGEVAGCPTPTPSPGSPPPIGTLVLYKLKFHTTYDVCSDEVANFSDYKNFYVLHDGDFDLHWLKDRTDPDDLAKPSNLPFTLNSNQKLKCTAYFRIDGFPLPGNPIIKIDQSSGSKYTFDDQLGSSPSSPFQLDFISKNLPYKDTIEHISSFALNFLYSNDGGANWLNSGASSNELYITWKEFDIADFHYSADDRRSMQVKLDKTGYGKNYILESLLHIGCTSASGKRTSEVEILDLIFQKFESLRVNRVRNGFANFMGYWRGSSAYNLVAGSRTDFGSQRSLRYLLKYGEARCGEWTLFFNHLAMCQGIIGMQDFALEIRSTPTPDGFEMTKFLVKNCEIRPRVNPSTGTSTFVLENFNFSKAQGNDDAINVFIDHVFSYHRPSGRFYDASYGIGKSKFPDLASCTKRNYCEKMLDGIFVTKPGGAFDVYIRHQRAVIATKVDYKTIKKDIHDYLIETIT